MIFKIAFAFGFFLGILLHMRDSKDTGFSDVLLGILLGVVLWIAYYLVTGFG